MGGQELSSCLPVSAMRDGDMHCLYGHAAAPDCTTALPPPPPIASCYAAQGNEVAGEVLDGFESERSWRGW